MPSSSVRNVKKRKANASGVIQIQTQQQPSASSNSALSSTDQLPAELNLVEQEAEKRKKKPSPPPKATPSAKPSKDPEQLSISDLLPADQIWALKNAAAKATETMRTRTIKYATRPWQDYTEYRRMALTKPDELINLPKLELQKTFRNDQPTQFGPIDETVSGILLRQVVSAIATHLQLDHALVEVNVFQHVQIGKEESLCSVEVLVDHFINGHCAASQVEASWAVIFFVGRCHALVKGNSQFNWCKGLIRFLRRHLMWQTIPACDEWITSLEAFIQSESLVRNSMSMCAKLLDAFAMKNQPLTTTTSLLPKRYYNAGLWIRL